MYNRALEDVLIESKKDFDDIKRWKEQEEIMKIVSIIKPRKMTQRP